MFDSTTISLKDFLDDDSAVLEAHIFFFLSYSKDDEYGLALQELLVFVCTGDMTMWAKNEIIRYVYISPAVLFTNNRYGSVYFSTDTRRVASN